MTISRQNSPFWDPYFLWLYKTNKSNLNNMIFFYIFELFAFNKIIMKRRTEFINAWISNSGVYRAAPGFAQVCYLFRNKSYFLIFFTYFYENTIHRP